MAHTVINDENQKNERLLIPTALKLLYSTGKEATAFRFTQIASFLIVEHLERI
jgi:hypothetical protein